MFQYESELLMRDIARPNELVAHTPAEGGEEWHTLKDHSLAVAELARSFAVPFGAGGVAYMLGLVHDAGKAKAAFQEYLFQCALEPGKRFGTVTHKDVGAVWYFGSPLGQALYGHHGGMPNAHIFAAELRAALDTRKAELEEAWLTFASLGIDVPDDFPDIPDALKGEPLARELYTRMLYSCLVDADALDTEAHWKPDKAHVRSDAYPSIQEYWHRFELDQQRLMNNVRARGLADTTVNRARARIYQHCVDHAQLPPGIFSLTVPTGGGKTRSATAFALNHARMHSMRRVIYVLPFLTITEQTVAELRKAFGPDMTVVEHHSNNTTPETDGTGNDEQEKWSRLSTENWDAPIIVTTSVQLYESLFANKPSKTRKLHNIANSVLILDEFQTVPEHYRKAIFSVLLELVHRYKVSVVLSTATQPVLDTLELESGKRNLETIELAPDPAALFRELKRVEYEWPVMDRNWTWEQVAAEIESHEQCLCIVNTIADAATLFKLISGPDTYHLSTRMYGKHRSDVIRTIRKRLAEGLPCRVVSTQLIEAGVDVDFPVVLRAFGPLVSIIQAAGRCNREGRLSTGRMIVFAPESGGLPPGAYRTATNETRTVLNKGVPDLADPGVVESFFREFYRLVDSDLYGIQPLRSGMNFADVATKFKVIDDNTISAIVAHTNGHRDHAASQKVVADVQNAIAYGGLRDALRSAQPYMVSVAQYRREQYLAEGLLRELCPGVYQWLGRYDRDLGIVDDRTDPAAIMV